MSETTRLAKAIARTGRASRREAERLIEAGRVSVGGEVVHHPGHPVDPEKDDIRIDNQPLPNEPPKVYYLLYKPKGTITSRNDPGGRPSVLDYTQGIGVRVEPVGRLDFDTEGALLLTNDGALAHKLTHPSSQVPKRYLAKVWKTPSEKKLDRVRRGIVLEDGKTTPCKVRVLETTDTGNAWIEVTVTEGRNRLIRRMFDAIGHPVNKLRRESFATVSLTGLDRGEIRPLTNNEVRRLMEISTGTDPRNAGKSSKKKKGFAKAKPRKRRPGSKKRVRK